MNPLYSVPGCAVERVQGDPPDLVVLHARVAHATALCPACGVRSALRHGYYTRRPADLPVLGRASRLCVRVRRFRCANPRCARCTFAEAPTSVLDVRGRRTRRLAHAQTRVALTAGAEAGARLLQTLAMPTSADTLLRLVRRTPLPAPDAPDVLGVDDWALRKGRTYGTILVDLEQRRVVDLLPDRTAATLTRWLRARPGIRVIARDRAAEYARAAARGAPEAVQVADRWHLLLNARQMLERWLASIAGRLRHLPSSTATDAADRAVASRPAFPRSPTEAAAGQAYRARWRAVYDEVRRQRAGGAPLARIARALDIAVPTARRFAAAAHYPGRAPHPPQASALDPYLAHLAARHAEGCENGRALWREIRARGYTGHARQVHRWLQQRRRAPAPTHPLGRRAAAAPPAPAHAPERGASLPSPRQLAWLLVQSPATLAPREAAVVTHITQDAEVAGMADLVRDFTALVRDRHAAPADRLARFEAWLAKARAGGLRAAVTFAAGLERDGAAVRAALTTPWSNGQTEGHVTKLKLLKRQMYGRANFDLLRRRVLLAA